MKSGEPKTERFEMRAPAELLRSVDQWRGRQPDVPNRSEAIRRLIEAGLSNTSAAKPSSDGSSGSGQPATDKSSPAARPQKPAATTRKPSAKPAAMSKEAQIRALREQGVR